MQRALRAKNKLGFINGEISKPTSTNDPLLEAWERCNDLVTSWLQNSISPSIKSSIALVNKASVVWTELQERFTQQNGARIFQLKRALAGLKQEQDPVSVYYGKLKTLWDELNVFDPLPDCSCGNLKILSDRYHRDCAIQFLMGLNDSYTNSRDQIMLLDPLPSVGKVLSLIQQQERQHLMLSSCPSPDSMALATKKFHPNFKPNAKSGQLLKNRPYCTHCHQTGHSLETYFKAGNAEPPTCTHCHMSGHVAEKCYKLHGYPPGHKLFSKGKSSTSFANSASTDQDEDSSSRIGLTREQYQQLLHLLQPKETPMMLLSSTNSTKTASHSFANAAKTSTISGISTQYSISLQNSLMSAETPWIIDTGAVALPF
ncbi:hypothetical protein F2P56_030100 [Juglans regia]|uniref:Uncharacterized protein LOC108988769 n=2 Tax=Juglans regia TaxID=51240 RepID=A0A2I4EE48_JUGRE|nr:uncharacterized protein LOC108988769 [Juglans regia]KAF5449681.1 hypothetical protein F2P56_030100 [Juglans regia]